ncbi:hypothetical protein [Sphingopyxis sp. 113P3]|uniref:hypothetical protein n=1 Tax=Sphingopyxis sp. (strain 113P3) TaxID=292913 RepID=UPI00130D5201|nr:hypothetical protein [Sphingopyxis sp. 113P3]
MTDDDGLRIDLDYWLVRPKADASKCKGWGSRRPASSQKLAFRLQRYFNLEAAGH